MTNGFTRRKEQSKDDIRKAAWELFGQFGVEKVSIVDIARKAGVSQATIYNNFGSKEALVREFVNTAVDQLVKQVEDVLSPAQPYWDKMSAFIQFISASMANGRPAAADSVRISNSYNLQNDLEIKKIQDSAREKMTALLLGLIREGKEQGQIRADLNDDAFRVYFHAFMDIFIDPQFQSRYDQDPRLVQDLGAIMIYGLSGRSG
jgi:AcrR family transcriptional regulator